MANYEFRKKINIVGFIASIAIAVAILIAFLWNWISTGVFNAGIAGLKLSGGLPGILTYIANVCAYFVAVVSGFYFVRSKRSPWFMVVQVIATIIIVFVVVIGLF